MSSFSFVFISFVADITWQKYNQPHFVTYFIETNFQNFFEWEMDHVSSQNP